MITSNSTSNIPQPSDVGPVTSALVLIDCNFSFVPAVENQIKEIEGVEFLFEISDTYKIILKLGAASKEELKDKVTDIIHLQNVRNTLSLIILR